MVDQQTRDFFDRRTKVRRTTRSLTALLAELNLDKHVLLLVEYRAPKPPCDGQVDDSALPLIAKLCEALHEQRVTYCHWKSNWKLHRWARGEGDLDLLIAREDVQRFTGILSRLGFKQAILQNRQIAGILDFYGFDEEARRFVHVHAHYQLILGHDLTKNFHLAIERPFLESAVRAGMFRVPAPEFEFVVFVLRMVLKYSVFDSLLRPRASSRTPLLRELEQLEKRADRAKAREVLQQHLPYIDDAFFDRCVESLRLTSDWTRFVVKQRLQHRFQANARRSQLSHALLTLKRRALKAGRRVAAKFGSSAHLQLSRKRLVSGGALIAMIGGDGAGKSAAVKLLSEWLSAKFVTRKVHLGKPSRSPITLAVIVALRSRRLLAQRLRRNSPLPSAGNAAGEGFPGYLQLIRWVCAGRDRYRLYVKARRFASGGGLVICDRYPVPQVKLMDGPNIARSLGQMPRNALVRFLLAMETRYYSRIMPPDLLIVLKLDPEIAVQRKADEHETHVRVRSKELWEVDWQGTRAHVVDASQTPERVLAQLQTIIWSHI